LIETDDTAGPTLPVLERNVYTVPFRAPIIEEIKLDSPVAGPITPLSTIVIKGRALRADVIQVKFGGSKLPAVIPTFVADNELKVVVPPDLRAGIQGLQVQQQFLMGSPATPHRGFESNVGPFVLAPSITQPNAPTFAQTSIDPNTQLLSGDITVNFTPKITKSQRVKLLLNEFHSPTTRAPFGHVLAAPRQNGIGANDQETDTVVFKVKDVAAGDYLVRVQVDGAESPLERDTDPNSQTFNEFIGPRITI
jgi:IPT/TIG domain-containing protein